MKGNPGSRNIWVELGTEFVRRLSYPFMAVVLIFLFGTIGYYVLGGGRWGMLDSAYMTSITLTTVGYGEIFEMGSAGRTFTIILMWLGLLGMLYATAIVTAFVVEMNLGQILRERKMEKEIEKLRNHYIVCGASETAIHIIRELRNTGRDFVLVEIDPEHLKWLQMQEEDILVVQGDPTEEEVLIKAGVQHALGVFVAQSDDARNMLITVVANFINPDVKVVSECQDNSLTNKFYRAGAQYVVNPNYIGGMRMASEMIRPQVVNFLDQMLRTQGAFRVEQVAIHEGSAFAGKTLRDADTFTISGLSPIALIGEDQQTVFNPSGQEMLNPGMVMIVIGSPEQVKKLREYCGE